MRFGTSSFIEVRNCNGRQLGKSCAKDIKTGSFILCIVCVININAFFLIRGIEYSSFIILVLHNSI